MESEPISDAGEHNSLVSHPQDTAPLTKTGKRTLPWLTFLPYLLALFFFLLVLRGSLGTDIVDPDAARHAMNGVFLHDLILSGQLRHPIAYARDYYAHFPAISLPYHPPLLPLVEALFFLIFGVHYFVARLVIALFTGGCVILLYRLVLKTGGSHFLAAACVLTFLGLRGSILVATDIMLELPALLFTVAALYLLAKSDAFGNWRSGVAFAVFAAAAVWTKQQAIFLGMVPFLQIAFTGKWRLLKNRWLWFSLVIFSILVGILIIFSVSSGFGSSPTWRHAGVVSMAVGRVRFYGNRLWGQFTPLGSLFIAGAFVFFLLTARRKRTLETALYLSWVLAFAAELLFLPPYDWRYLFFMHPPLLLLGYAGVLELIEPLRWKPAAEIVVAAAIVVLVAFNYARPPVFLHGPSQVADVVANPETSRVVYCGRTNGAFSFARRLLDPKLQSVVIRGDKLSTDLLEPDRFEHFAHDYGVNYVILEQTGTTRAWDGLTASPSPSMEWQRDIPLRSSFQYFNGTLRIYRFNNPSTNPRTTLHPNSGIYRQELDLTK